MSPPPVLSFDTSTYLTLTFPPTSPFYSQPPSSLNPSDPSPITITHVSQIGELKDSHIYEVKVEKSQWEMVKEQVMGGLKGMEGVKGVEEMRPPKMRAKRGGEL